MDVTGRAGALRRAESVSPGSFHHLSGTGGHAAVPETRRLSGEPSRQETRVCHQGRPGVVAAIVGPCSNDWKTTTDD